MCRILGRFAPPDEPRLRSAWAALWGCVAVALILYLPTLDHSYFADDHIYLGFGTSKVINLPPAELPRIFTELMNPWEYLPIRDLSYWIDIQLWGGFPDGFHFSNIAWYGASCFAAAFFARELLSWADPGLAPDHVAVLVALVAALFAVHPAHVEPVAWIAGRKDLLAGMFLMIALGVFVGGINAGYRYRELLLACLALTAALFSKGAVVGGAMLFPVLSMAGRGAQRTFRDPRLLLYVLLPVTVAVSITVGHSLIGADAGIRIENHVSPDVLVERASRIWTTLLGIMLAPVDLRLIYDVYAVSSLHWLVSACTVIGVAVAGAVLLRGHRSLAGVGALLAVCGATPYLQIVPFSTWSMASERFVFVPILGIVFLAVSLVDAAGRIGATWSRTAIGLVAGLVVVGAYLGSQRLEEWVTPRSLVERQRQATGAYLSGVRLYLQTMPPGALQHEEARGLVQEVEPEKARLLLEKWLEVRNAYFSNRAATGLQKMDDPRPYCNLAPDFRVLLDRAAGWALSERDLAFSSMVRSLKRDFDLNLPRMEQICMELSS